MVRIGHRFFGVLCLSARALLVSAQDRKALTAIPPGGFQFAGTWNCTGAMGNGKPHRSTFTGNVILGTGYLAKYLIGYDSQQKRLVEFDANNFGAATYSSADGWVDGVLTMTSAVTDDLKAPYAANRFLYAIAPADTFTMEWQISKTSALNWTRGDHLVCKRDNAR